jgi:hypothetical protein
MTRRAFIALLGGTAAAWPLSWRVRSSLSPCGSHGGMHETT